MRPQRCIPDCAVILSASSSVCVTVVQAETQDVGVENHQCDAEGSLGAQQGGTQSSERGQLLVRLTGESVERRDHASTGVVPSEGSSQIITPIPEWIRVLIALRSVIRSIVAIGLLKVSLQATISKDAWRAADAVRVTRSSAAGHSHFVSVTRLFTSYSAALGCGFGIWRDG